MTNEPCLLVCFKTQIRGKCEASLAEVLLQYLRNTSEEKLETNYTQSRGKVSPNIYGIVYLS